MIVIGDALHTQRTPSAQIVESGGEYLWPIKGNQARTQWAIRKLLEAEVEKLKHGRPLSKHCHMTSQVVKGHGRLEKWTLLVSSRLNEYLAWPDVAQVFHLERTVWSPKQPGSRRQVVDGLSSLTAQEASSAQLLGWIRPYGGIEHGLHYRRDVTLREDATRLTVGNVGQNMAIFNNLVISLCLQQGLENLPQARGCLRLNRHKPWRSSQPLNGFSCESPGPRVDRLTKLITRNSGPRLEKCGPLFPLRAARLSSLMNCASWHR